MRMFRILRVLSVVLALTVTADRLGAVRVEESNFNASRLPAPALAAQPLPPSGREHYVEQAVVRPPADNAPGYCPAIGGSTTFESISDVFWEEQGDGAYLLTVQVFIANPTGCVYGEPCPVYDESPEYVNAWVDWDGDRQWTAAEQVMDKALTGYAGINYQGTMTAIEQVVAPADLLARAALLNEDQNWLRVNLGYGYDPNSPCEQSWSFGNVVDKPAGTCIVEAVPQAADQKCTLKLPKIKEIQITNASSNPVQRMPPLTGLLLNMKAILDIPEGYEEVKVRWEGPDLDYPGEGNPYTDFRPTRGDHGLRTVKATLVYRNKETKEEGTTSLEHTYKLFFAKYPGFKTQRPDSKEYEDGNGNQVVDWLEYWGRDGAIPALAMPGYGPVIYNPSNPDYGSFSQQKQMIELGESAPTSHGLREITSPPNCAIRVGDTQGIDSVAEIVTHERKHEWVWRQWYVENTWTIGTTVDSDDPTPNAKDDDKGDSLPDDFETTVSHTDPQKTDTCNVNQFSMDDSYATYGDNELLAMRAAVGVQGIAEKDWSFPGRQTTPPEVAAADSTPVDSKASGPVTEYSRIQEPGPVRAGLAVLTGLYRDSGVDANGDGQLEALRVTVGVNVSTPTRYSLVGWLAVGSGVEFVWANHSIELGTGIHEVDLDFSGDLLNLHGVNGPFTLRRVELRTGEQSQLVALADNAYTTANYAAASFTPPAVTLTGEFVDNANDTDGDTLYNVLHIQAGVEVHAPGNYTLVGWLNDVNGQAVSGGVAEVTFTSSGLYTLAFDGQRIRWSRANGPYTLRELEVRNANLDRVAFNANAYTTAVYTASQFQGTNNTASYSDQGLDINGDGSFDYLRLAMQVNVAEAGIYQVEAWLKANENTTLTSAARKVALSAGENTVTLDFPGGPLHAAGLDGPYQVTGLMVTNANHNLVDYHKNAHATLAYNHTSFAPPLVSLTNGYLDYAADVNGDGANDYLNIDVGINGGNDGVVIVQGRLVDSADVTIQTVQTTIQVTANVALSATLPFSATQIAANGKDGPYELRNLLIYHTGDPTQLVAISNAHATQAFRAQDLTLSAAPTQFAIYLPNLQLAPDGVNLPDDLAREREMFALLNQVRAANNLPALNLNARLTQAARRHSRDMAEHDLTSEISSDGSTQAQRLTDVGYNWALFGESWSRGSDLDAQAALNAMLDHPIARAALLDSRFVDVGVGYAFAVSSSRPDNWVLDLASPATGISTSASGLPNFDATFEPVGGLTGGVIYAD